MSKLVILFIFFTISAARANLEGPFLFWGPKFLGEFKRSALKSLDQDDLIRIYERQSAVVVFNNQNSAPLTGESFPRLRKLLERKTLLVLPQGFLDVHPDYVNNETQVFTLQGPNSERDAEITETFNRLEDIYGSGQVLGVLGNSVSSEYADREETRKRRAAEEEKEEESARETRTDKPDKALPEYALYNASTNTVSTSPIKALIYSSKWPVFRIESEEIVLKRPIATTVDVKLAKQDSKSASKKIQVTKVIVTFLHEDGNKISLHLRFTTQEGWWVSGGAELHFPKGTSVLLQAPPGRAAPSAVLGKSYHCSQPVVYVGQNATLTFYDLQMQPFMEEVTKFADAFDCTGFTTEPLWSGALITSFLAVVMFIAITMIFDVKTNDRYESTKGKSLVITVVE